MITVTQKRHYAHAVLSGEFKKDAYIRHINPTATHPSSGAWRLERTKAMPAIFSEVRAELDKAKELEEHRHAALRGSLRLLERLNADSATLSPRESIRVLSQTTRLLTVLGKPTDHQQSTMPVAGDDDWRRKAHSRHQIDDLFGDIIL